MNDIDELLRGSDPLRGSSLEDLRGAALDVADEVRTPVRLAARRRPARMVGILAAAAACAAVAGAGVVQAQHHRADVAAGGGSPSAATSWSSTHSTPSPAPSVGASASADPSGATGDFTPGASGPASAYVPGASASASAGPMLSGVHGARTGVRAPGTGDYADTSELLDPCASDFVAVERSLAPTAEALPPGITWRQLVPFTATELCNRKDPKASVDAYSLPATVESVRLSYEYRAIVAWQVAWAHRMARHDVAGADAAMRQYLAYGLHPLVVKNDRAHGEKPGGSTREVGAFMKAHDLAGLRASRFAVSDAWTDPIR